MAAPEFPDGADVGNWTASINQNDSGAPYFSSADGLRAEDLAELNEAFAALFDAGISIFVIRGRTTKERWNSDLAEQTDADTNPYIIEVTGDQTTTGTDGAASFDGADTFRTGTAGSFTYHATTAGADGTDGGDGGTGGRAIVNGAVNLVHITGDTNLTIFGGSLGDLLIA